MPSFKFDVKSIFCGALERPTGPDRAAFVADACAADSALRAEVEKLVAAHERAGDFLETASGSATSAVALAMARSTAAGVADALDEIRSPALSSWDPAAAEMIGKRIGPYELHEEIGQGGMGAVYMALQEKPVRRQVALKVIKAGMDTVQVVARFEAERQALALMEHPNIARVFDAGTTDKGRPFFVMELVHGVPITQYCDQARLNPRERLALFIPVCQAIQHAHQKGIIHRDIKPSNVLVTLVDGKPVPKVIDFGVAKAVDQRLTEKTLFTQFGSIVGTLEYMSPEQAGLSGMDVDTRSDVYALGVLLYELLTGTTPLEHERLRDAGYAEILRRIKEEEPPKPSARLSDSGERLASIAAVRRTEPSRLARAVRGDLDWIVMKAIEKSRTRRYESAGGFARDVQGYLDGDAVEACPPSAVYKLRKFGRKYRGPLTVVAAFAGLIVAGSAISLALAVRATQAERKTRLERNRALNAEATAKAEGEKSKRSAEQAEAVLKFFQEQILAAARPEGEEGGLGRNATIREAVDAAAPKISGTFKDQPTVEAFIRSALGVTYVLQGDPGRAITELERGTQLFEAQLGPDHPRTLEAKNSLAEAYHAAGRTADALRLHEATLKTRESQLGPDQPDTLLSRASLARDYEVMGRTADAIRLNKAILKVGATLLGTDNPFLFAVRSNLAVAYMSMGRTADAIELYEATLNACEAQLGIDNPATLTVRANLASAYEADGRVSAAIVLHERTLKARESKLGPDHPKTLFSRCSLAGAYRSAGRTAEAVALYESTCPKLDATLGSEHPSALACRGGLADAYVSAGRAAEAINLYEATYKILEKTLGPDDGNRLANRGSLGAAYLAAGRVVDAINLYEVTIKAEESALGPEHPITLACRSNLALAYFAAGRITDAINVYEPTIKAQESTLGLDHPGTQKTRATMMKLCYQRGLFDRALPLYEYQYRSALRKHGPQHIDTTLAARDLAEIYARLRRYDEAQPLFLESLAGMKDRPDSDPIVVLTKAYLAKMHEAQVKYAQVEQPAHASQNLGDKDRQRAQWQSSRGLPYHPGEPHSR
jgi:serine/threonine protein kinase/tetratricopeptide (TPR) repeat protein